MIKTKMKSFMKACSDQPFEIQYFSQLIQYLDTLVTPNRVWEEKKKLTSSSKKKCATKDLNCGIDQYHCGKKYKQYVLGRLGDTMCFIHCKNYEVLNISDWTLDKNDMFIKYISSAQPKQTVSIDLPVCPIFPIRIYFSKSMIQHEIVQLKSTSTKSLTKQFTTLQKPGAVTSREICMLVHLRFSFYLVEKDDGTYENFVLLTRISHKKIMQHYREKHKKMPKLHKIKP